MPYLEEISWCEMLYASMLFGSNGGDDFFGIDEWECAFSQLDSCSFHAWDWERCVCPFHPQMKIQSNRISPVVSPVMTQVV